MISGGHFLKVNFSRYFILLQNMSKKSKKKGGSNPSASTGLDSPAGPVKLDKERNILVEIYAKPGAKQNAITGISDEGINIQINAPPVEGSANTELVKFMASFLGLKSSHVSLEKGHKSRNKVLKISGNISFSDVIKKINVEVPDQYKLPEQG